MSGIESYFDLCKTYWMNNGDSEGIATIKALWWDCVEVWNTDKSWTDEKIEFINRYRKYKPYGPVPEESMVELGMA